LIIGLFNEALFAVCFVLRRMVEGSSNDKLEKYTAEKNRGLLLRYYSGVILGSGILL
jgi:hypothetical protein